MLDLTTTVLFALPLALIQVIVTYFFMRFAQSYRGIPQWTVAGVMVIIGASLYSLRGILPDFYTIVLANSINILALCFLHYGIRLFLELPTPPRLVRLCFAPPLIAVPYLSYFTFVEYQIVQRTIFMSAVTLLMTLAIAYALFFKSAPTLRRSHRFTAIIFVLYALFHLLHLLPLLLFDTSRQSFDLWVLLLVIGTSIFGILWSAGIALMITERLLVELQYTATHDFLTATLNRRAAQAVLEREIPLVVRKGTPFSILLLDIDHFKRINDHYGHAVGDSVLKTVVQRLVEAQPPTATLARWGGEEFLMILPATSHIRARAIAESVRARIAETPMPYAEHMIPCSVSIGVATLHPTSADFDDLLRRADHALYHAKSSGRNRVMSELDAIPFT